MMSSFSSRGPSGGNVGLKPDIAAPGQTIFSAASLSGNQGQTLSGTSMASPHTAGLMAILKQQHPSWTVEELKALAMNTADADVYLGLGQSGAKEGPQTVGAGRMDVPAAIADGVLAYSADDPGAVSVSFGNIQATTSTTYTRTVNVVNKSASDADYTLSIDPRVSNPGASFSIVGSTSLHVAANSSTSFVVQLAVDTAAIKNTRDPNAAATQSGNPRQWVSEASGLILLTPVLLEKPTGANSVSALRVPVYAAVRPASAMSTTESEIDNDLASGSLTLHLTGTPVNTGSSFPTDMQSTVSTFELQGISGQATLPGGASPYARDADLHYIGVTSDYGGQIANSHPASASTLYFGLSTWGNWSTPATENEFDIYIDTNNDHTYDYVLFNTRLTATDVFVDALAHLPSGSATAQTFLNGASSNFPTAIYNSNVLIMP